MWIAWYYLLATGVVAMLAAIVFLTLLNLLWRAYDRIADLTYILDRAFSKSQSAEEANTIHQETIRRLIDEVKKNDV